MAKLKKAFIEPITGGGDPIEVLFNPNEYSVEHSNQYVATALPGMPNPVLQFANGNSDTLTLELLLDSYTPDVERPDFAKTDVRTKTDALSRLMQVDSGLHAPKRVAFRWGVLRFEAVIERLSKRFTMFLEDGTPVRATVSVTFREYKTVKQQLEEIRRQSADRSKRHQVKQGEQLWHIATREYGHPRFWKRIAAHNAIDNPRLLEAGHELRLPALDSLERRLDGAAL